MNRRSKSIAPPQISRKILAKIADATHDIHGCLNAAKNGFYDAFGDLLVSTRIVPYYEGDSNYSIEYW